MPVIYEDTTDEKELRKQEEVGLIEKLILPAIAYEMLRLNIKQNPGRDKDYQDKMERLRVYCDEVISKDGSVQENLRRRRLSRVVAKVVSYSARMGYDTRKVLLICLILWKWLVTNEVFEPDDMAHDIFNSMRDGVIKFSHRLEHYDKLEVNAVKKSLPFLNKLQEMGYFKFEVVE